VICFPIFQLKPERRSIFPSTWRVTAGNRELFKPIVDALLNHDDYLVLADYGPYVECSETAARTYQDAEAWARMSILNTARCGFFSSDRTIQEYCRDVWNVPIRHSEIGSTGANK